MSNGKAAGAGQLLVPVMIALAAMAVLLGVYFRFKGLDKSALAVDEYYIITSVNSILQHGLPRLEGGGFYNRGILLQYLVAPLFALGMSPEYAFRLLTVLCNLAALPAVFLLARQIAGSTAGCIALVLFSLSLWEVEFARFARMYAPYATLFLWHLYFLYRCLVLDDSRALKWMYLLSFMALFVYVGAIFMVVLNFLPLLLRPARRPALEYLLPPVLLLVTVAYGMFDFRRFGVVDYLPPGLMEQVTAAVTLPVYLPPLLLPVMAQSQPWLFLFMLPLLISLPMAGLWLYRAVTASAKPLRNRLLALLPVGLLVLALLNLFGLVVYAALGMLLLSGLTRGQTLALLRRPLVLGTGLGLLAALAYWFAFALLNDNWQQLVPQTNGAGVRDALFALFGYPAVYWEILVQWLQAMPLQTLLMAVLIAATLWLALGGQSPADNGTRLLGAVLLGCCVLVAMLYAPYSTTRYTFFLYPVALILTAAGLTRLPGLLLQQQWSRGLATLGAVAGLMLVSEDFEARHLREIDTDRVTYRIDYPAGRQDQYYIRWDYRSAAATVNANWRPGDMVISSEYSVPHYLLHLDYFYMDEGNKRIWDIAVSRGTREVWEGLPLLHSGDALLDAIRRADGNVWLIIRSDRHAYRMAGELAVSEQLQAYRYFRSIDGYLDVFMIPAGTLGEPQGKVQHQR